VSSQSGRVSKKTKRKNTTKREKQGRITKESHKQHPLLKIKQWEAGGMGVMVFDPCWPWGKRRRGTLHDTVCKHAEKEIFFTHCGTGGKQIIAGKSIEGRRKKLNAFKTSLGPSSPSD